MKKEEAFIHRENGVSVTLADERTYPESMKNIIIPFLQERMEAQYLKREDDHPIYCETYHVGNALGTVMISHGFTESALKYQEVIFCFLQAGYQVVIFEHCGHGRSYRLTDNPYIVHVDRWQRYTDDLLWIARGVKRQAPDRPLILYGHSMGGGIAAAAAAAEPGLFQCLILSSPMIAPLTGKLPLPAAGALARFLCLIGKDEVCYEKDPAYDPGAENFTNSAASSEARFSWYKAIRDHDIRFQTCAASNGWIREAVDLSLWLRSHAARRIVVPVLLFQAGHDALVSDKAQNDLIRDLRKQGSVAAWLTRVPGARHEIYNSGSRILEGYWERILTFLNAEQHTKELS